MKKEAYYFNVKMKLQLKEKILAGSKVITISKDKSSLLL